MSEKSKIEELWQAITTSFSPQELKNRFSGLLSEEALVLLPKWKEIKVDERIPFFTALFMLLDPDEISPLFFRIDPALFETLKVYTSKEMVTHLLYELKEQNERWSHTLVEKTEALQQEIDGLIPATLFPGTLDGIRSKLKELETELVQQSKAFERGIELAFHNGDASFASTLGNIRQLLLEKLSYLKDCPLERKLYTLFSKEGEAPLANETPITEALVLLGCTQASDFFKLGLLPHGNSEKPEELAGALNRLYTLGLKTVGDLRREGLYSFEILKEWISSKHS